MSFNKRYVNYENLQIVKQSGIDYLVRWITKPDALFIEDDYSDNICKIIRDNKSKKILKKKLIEIGFYES